ncbi:MAG: 2-dehydropantoate 2-reductase [Proteobacteria bacterium]|nr:2-dehydropantoate 2-reductase [Pseudomonadota bacterium]
MPRTDQPHTVIIGAGAVGGYTGAHLARAGFDITFVDAWPEHVEQIRGKGVRVSGTQGDYTLPVKALHIAEVQQLVKTPVDIAIIATKSFDTAWFARMIRDYLAPEGFVVSMQNSINEYKIADIVGWDRTVGCVLNTIGVSTVGPGHLTRHRTPGGDEHPVFRIGEVHGRVTPRAQRLAAMLKHVDGSMVTTNLWGERWSKLATNAMQMGILGATGLCNEEIIGDAPTRKLIIGAAAESVQVARAHGFDMEPIVYVELDCWLRAAQGDEASVQTVEAALFKYLARQTESGRKGHGSLGRDILGGRRSEIDAVNGMIADKADELGIAAPIHRGLTTIVRRIERGELTPAKSNILGLIAGATERRELLHV